LLRFLTVLKGSPASTVGQALAAALLIAGLGSLALAVMPPNVGNVVWEFGALGELAAVSPLAVMGMAAAVAVAIVERWSWTARLLGLAAVLLAAVGIGALVLLLTDTPILIGAARSRDPAEARGIKVVLVKSVALLGLFSAGMTGIGIAAVRTIRTFERTR
jgi:hypothetical protein